MNDNTKTEKAFSQLGLPPMELAEKNPKDRNSSSFKRCIHPLLQKTLTVLMIILITSGAYIVLISVLQGFDNNHTTEIVIVTVNKDSPNVTLQQENVEIYLQFKNKTTLPNTKRVKRDLTESSNFHNKETDVQVLPEQNIQKARDLVMNYNHLCDNVNREAICKYFVKELEALKQIKQISNKNDDSLTKTNDQKLNLGDVDNANHYHDGVTTEKSKRETNPLANLEVLKSTMNMPFEARDSYGYVPELPTPHHLHYSHQGPVHQPSDSCLLARLLKQTYPNAAYGVGDYLQQNYETNPLPYSRFVPPVFPGSFPQSREANSPRRTIHQQDVEIFMRFLTPQPTEHTSNSTRREVECLLETLPCSNGEGCVSEKQWCDGNVDCSDVSDETSCSCKARVDKSRLCDGYFDCPFGEDEMGCHGCSETTFSCEDLDMNSRTTCFTKEMRCNNLADCPNHRDEMDCTMLAPTLHKNGLFAVSNTEGFLHRNFKGDWLAVCKNPYMWAHDACRRETGLIVRPPFIQAISIDPLLKVNYLNTGQEGMLQMSNTCFNSTAIYVTCPDLLCGTRIMSNTQILRENAEAENHLFGRNKRFLLTGHPYQFMFFNNRMKRQISNVTSEGQPLKSVESDPDSDKDNERLRNKRTESRVVGGKPSQPAAWPWVVAMYRDGMFHCGGIILTQSWVMSAAHCVSKFWEHYYEIQVGMLRRFSFSPQEQNHKVTHVIVNQFYSQEDMKNDLSLLKVLPSIQFSRWVRPICLPGPETAGTDWLWGPPAGTSCTTVGWGATVEHGPDPDHLREVELPIWDHCKHREDRAGKEICAGFSEGGKDACQGDSGGPLLCKNPLNPQQWYIAGIVSHGDGCARKDEPGVYTRVSLFVKWIRYNIFSDVQPTIQPKQECPGFKCISGIAKCLPKKRICDKIVDCLSGEDEMNCNSMRSTNPFDNLFLTTPSKDDEIILNNFLQTKEVETERNVIEKLVHKEIEDLAVTKPSMSNKNARESSFNIQEDNLNNNDVTKFLETNMEKSSTNTRDIKISDIDLLLPSTLEVTNSKSSENENSEEDHVTMDPSRQASVEIDKINRGDNDDAITMSFPRDNLEAMSSKLENNKFRDADIHEDWPDEITPTEALSSSTTVKQDSEEDTLRNEFKNKGKELLLTSTENQISNNTTGDKLHLSAHINNNNTGPESKDLIIDLPEFDTPTASPTTENTRGDTVTHNEISNSDHDDKHNSKVITDLNGNGILDKIKDIVTSQLVPAKIVKKHRIPREFECRHIYQIIPYYQRCDRKADCEDGTDELSCTCYDYLSRFDKHLLCDGVFDCADGQDEIDCFTCSEDHFLCKKSQQCLPIKYVCDGKPQCPLGEDELDCYALTNGKSIIVDNFGVPKINLQGFLTKKHVNDWHVVCDENSSTEQQELAAAHICHYLGFSSANRYHVRHINIKDEDLIKTLSSEDFRSRRETEEGMPVHFAYRKAEETARHIIIKEPELLKEQCVPNVTKTCMSLYVYCDHGLYTNTFDSPNEIVYNREAETTTHMWPWVAKVFVDGDYKCSGVLVDFSWALVSHSCLWDTLLHYHHVTVVLGSHRTLISTKGMYDQTFAVDAKKDLYHSKAVLLHLKEPALYSPMVKPMRISFSNVQEEKPTTCLAIGQDEKNNTVGIFLQEFNDNCDLHSRCYQRTETENICAPGIKSRQPWAGVISCHSDRGWYPAASFVDSRGECGIGNNIIASEIGNFKNEIKTNIERAVSESIELNSASDCDGVRCGRGRCIKLGNICDGVSDCEDQRDELDENCKWKNETCTKNPFHHGCQCSSAELKCHNGKCVAKQMFGDGKDDCGDGTDEPVLMSCSHYLARVEPTRLCDGVLHCEDRTDEDPMFCKCFAKNNFKCNKASSQIDLCVAPDVVCDGVKDCPNGEDEQTCIGLSAPEGTTYGTGQVMVRSHGVWHSKCYRTQNHTRSELEAICRSLGFISGHAKQLAAPPSLQPFNHIVLDSFSDVKLNNKTSLKIRNTNQPLATVLVGESPDNCFPVYIECL